jgi:hypothetical protein
MSAPISQRNAAQYRARLRQLVEALERQHQGRFSLNVQDALHEARRVLAVKPRPRDDTPEPSPEDIATQTGGNC